MMKTSRIIKEIVIVLIAIAPLLYYFYLWDSLPYEIPIHFDAEGNPNGFGSKSVMGRLMLFMTVGMYLLLLFAPQLNPKKNFQNNSKTYFKIRVLLIVFFTVINFLLILSVKEKKLDTSYFYAALALLFAVLGNYFTKVRPNFFLGVRTPWTLKSESNWRKTNVFVGRLWFFCGVILAVLVFVLPQQYKFPVFISIVLVIIIIPAVYSYFIYQQSKSKSENENNQNSEIWYGVFYFNPKDKRIFLPQRFGIGWTMNFGNPYAYLVIIAFIGLIILLQHL